MTPRNSRNSDAQEPTADDLRRTDSLLAEVEADVQQSVYSRYPEHLREFNRLIVSLSKAKQCEHIWPIAPVAKDAFVATEDRLQLEKAKLVEILSNVRELHKAIGGVPAADADRASRSTRDPAKAAEPAGARAAVPPWFQIAGFLCGGATLLFFMGLVLLSVLGRPVPDQAKPLVAFLFSIGAAMSVTFLGGEAAASGKIPFLGKSKPLVFSASSGIAVLIILLVLLNYLYVR